MIIEECTSEKTKLKFFDDCIVQNVETQKEYIDNVLSNLINKTFLF